MKEAHTAIAGVASDLKALSEHLVVEKLAELPRVKLQLMGLSTRLTAALAELGVKNGGVANPPADVKPADVKPADVKPADHKPDHKPHK